MKREWYVAVCDVSGMFAANPPSFEGADIYGPYTRQQADEAEAIGDGFPEETFSIVTFKADSRPPFRSLLKMLRDKVKDSAKDGPYGDETEEQYRSRQD